MSNNLFERILAIIDCRYSSAFSFKNFLSSKFNLLTSKRPGYYLIAILISLLASVCFSTKAIFVKLAYRDSTVDSISLLALRMIFSLPFFALAAAFSSRKESNVKFSTRQWLLVALVTRYSSLAAITAALVAPVAAMVMFGQSWFTLAVLCMTALLIWRHRGNIAKLRAGTESRIRLKRRGTGSLPDSSQ